MSPEIIEFNDIIQENFTSLAHSLINLRESESPYIADVKYLSNRVALNYKRDFLIEGHHYYLDLSLVYTKNLNIEEKPYKGMVVSGRIHRRGPSRVNSYCDFEVSPELERESGLVPVRLFREFTLRDTPLRSEKSNIFIMPKSIIPSNGSLLREDYTFDHLAYSKDPEIEKDEREYRFNRLDVNCEFLQRVLAME